MSVALQHPIWSEDVVIRDPWLEERPFEKAAGTIAIHWRGADGGHELLLAGNAADDFMERYRAASDFNDRSLVLKTEIEAALSL